MKFTSRIARARELAGYLNISARLLALLVGSAVVAGFAEAAILALIAYSAAALSTGAQSVDLTLTGIDVGRAGIPMLLGIGLALVVARLAAQEVGAYVPAHLGADLQFTMREELWTSFLGASWEAQGGEREGALQEVLTVQVPRATEALLYAASGVAAAVTFTALVVSSLLLNVAVAALAILAAGVLFLGLRPLTGLARRFSQQLAQDNAEYASGVSEGVRLAKEILVFGVGDAHQARTSSLLDRVRRSFFRGQLTTRNIIPLYQAAALLIILGGLAALYVSGTARIAALGAVVLLLIRALNYSQTAQAAYHQFHEALPFVDSVSSAREKYAHVREPDGDIELPSVGMIEACDISFAYIAGRDVLRHVSFAVAPGEAVGIVGPSGAGKSTLLDLVLRLRVPRDGEVLVDGVPVQRFAPADWARRVAYVPQDCRLLAASVLDNIAFFRPWIDAEAVRCAARLAHIHDEIEALASGYSTLIGPRADTVSGGQRQRICLARALAGRPDLLLLDEPMSALDLQSEDLVQRSLLDLRGGVTMLIVAHRLSTLSTCDRIMVFADGRLEASGPADELVADNAFFRAAVSLSQRGSGPLLP